MCSAHEHLPVSVVSELNGTKTLDVFGLLGFCISKKSVFTLVKV